MKIGIYILSVCNLLLTISCSKNIPEDFAIGRESVLTVTASFPENNSIDTRTISTQKTDSKEIELRWQQDDKIALYFKTNSGIIIGAESQVKNISPDGKKADFDVIVPAEITGNYDLFGVHGAESLISSDGKAILLDARPSPFTPLNDLTVPIYFKKENISVEGGTVEVSFKHYGALQLLTLKNNSENTIVLGNRMLVIDGLGDNWFYDSNELKQPVYDIVGGSMRMETITYSTPSAVHYSIISDNLKLAQWVMPNGEVPPAISFKATINGEEQTTITTKRARTAALSTGKAYHLYATWDGSELNFSDETSTQPYKISMILENYEDNIMNLTINAAAEDQDDIWIDLNNNGQMEGHEKITNFGILTNYIGTSDIITIYGKVTELYCPYNYFTSMDVSGCKAMTYLNCAQNRIATLNVSGCTALTELFCDYNEINSLDLSDCIALTNLICYGNSLKSLNILGCNSLTELNCSQNALTSLDATNCSALTKLDCASNSLTTLDVTGCTSLLSLNFFYNQISGSKMTDLMNSLHDNDIPFKELFVIHTLGDGNIFTAIDAEIAKNKNWNILNSYGLPYVIN